MATQISQKLRFDSAGRHPPTYLTERRVIKLTTTNEKFIQSCSLKNKFWYTYDEYLVAKSVDLCIRYYVAETISDSGFHQLKIFITKLEKIMQEIFKTLFLFTSESDYNEVSISGETEIINSPLNIPHIFMPDKTIVTVTIKNATEWIYAMMRLYNMTYSDFNFNLPTLPDKNDILEFIK